MTDLELLLGMPLWLTGLVVRWQVRAWWRRVYDPPRFLVQLLEQHEATRDRFPPWEQLTIGVMVGYSLAWVLFVFGG